MGWPDRGRLHQAAPTERWSPARREIDTCPSKRNSESCLAPCLGGQLMSGQLAEGTHKVRVLANTLLSAPMRPSAKHMMAAVSAGAFHLSPA